MVNINSGNQQYSPFLYTSKVVMYHALNILINKKLNLRHLYNHSGSQLLWWGGAPLKCLFPIIFQAVSHRTLEIS